MKKLLLILMVLSGQSVFSAEEASNNPPNLNEIQAELAQLQAANAPAADTVVTETSAISTEKQIPVNLDSPKKAEAGSSSKKALAGFGLALAMAAGAYFLFKKYRFSNRAKSPLNQIKVLSQHYLGPKKSLAIIRVAGESILIGVTDHNISMIKSLSLIDDEVPEETPNQFSSVFAKTEQNTNQQIETTQAEDDFAISGIKDFVSTKLKNMRSIQ